MFVLSEAEFTVAYIVLLVFIAVVNGMVWYLIYDDLKKIINKLHEIEQKFNIHFWNGGNGVG